MSKKQSPQKAKKLSAIPKHKKINFRKMDSFKKCLQIKSVYLALSFDDKIKDYMSNPQKWKKSIIIEETSKIFAPKINKLKKAYPKWFHEDVTAILQTEITKALNKYDPTRGIPFRGFLSKYVNNTPVKFQFNKLLKANEVKFNSRDKEKKIEDLAEDRLWVHNPELFNQNKVFIKAINKMLSPTEFDIIISKIVYQDTYKEIAERHNSNTSTIKTKLNRIKEKLRKELA